MKEKVFYQASQTAKKQEGPIRCVLTHTKGNVIIIFILLLYYNTHTHTQCHTHLHIYSNACMYNLHSITA